MWPTGCKCVCGAQPQQRPPQQLVVGLVARHSDVDAVVVDVVDVVEDSVVVLAIADVAGMQRQQQRLPLQPPQPSDREHLRHCCP